MTIANTWITTSGRDATINFLDTSITAGTWTITAYPKVFSTTAAAFTYELSTETRQTFTLILTAGTNQAPAGVTTNCGESIKMKIGTSFECQITGITDPNLADTHTVALVGPINNWLTLEGNSIELSPKLHNLAGFHTLELFISDNNSVADPAGVLSYSH